MCFQPGFEEETSMETPIVRYCAVSAIEPSHKAAITDVQWVPDHMEVRARSSHSSFYFLVLEHFISITVCCIQLTKMGVPKENTSGKCVQIMTCACDQ